MKLGNSGVPLIRRYVSDVFDWSASDNLPTSSGPILFPILSENEIKQQVYYS
jgi:hypothetical protein